MQKSLKYYILILSIVGSIATINAQTDTIIYNGKAKAYKNAIALRWNTTNASDYIKVIPNGFIIKKYKLFGNDFVYENQFYIRIKKPKDYAIKDLDTNNRNVKIAYGVLDKLLNWKYTNASSDLGTQLKNKQQLNTIWGFGALAADMDTSAANMMGVRFFDNQIDNNNAYMYQIYCPFKNPNIVSDTLWIRIEKGYQVESKNYLSLKHEKLEKKVSLKWQTEKKYSAYFIERAELNSNNFLVLDPTPNVSQINEKKEAIESYFTDTFLANYIKYKYRICAIDIFADKYYSDEIVAWGVDKTPPSSADNFKADLANNRTVKLRWSLPKNMSPDTKGFSIYKQEKDEAPMVLITPQILPLNSNQYLDTFENNVTGYTYYLLTTDTANNASISQAYIMKPDSIPPAQPKGLKAIVNKKGIVTLTWEMGKEKDLDGYLVYFSNHLKHDFSIVIGNPLMDSICSDTLELNLLNKKLYYKIVAVDKNFNRSTQSEIVEVLRPDTIPPVSPVITKYNVSDSNITIEWVKSSSFDVKYQKLIRTQLNKIEVKKFDLRIKDSLFIDNTVGEGIDYRYEIVAIDNDSNVSKPTNPLILAIPDKGIIKGVSEINCTYDSLAKSVKITWKFNPNASTKYIIYKGKTANEMSTLVTLNGAIHQYQDRLIKKGETYHYTIVVTEGNGRRSIKNKEIVLIIQ